MLDNASGNKRIAKNTVFLYLRMIVILLVSLYTTRVVLRVLGAEDYGVFNVVGGFVTMFSFLNTSLVGATQRFYNFETSKNGTDGLRRVYTTSLIIQTVLAICILLVLETFGVWYVNHIMVVPPNRISAANYLLQFSIVSLVLVILQNPYSAAVVSFERMDYYALVGIIEVLLRLLIVIVLPFISADKLIIYGVLILCTGIVNFLLYFVYAKKSFKNLKIIKPISKQLFVQMLSFSGWNMFGTFAGLMKTQGLNMLLNYFFGPIVNASRGISGQIMAALQGFSLNIVAAFRPQLVDSYALSNYERTRTIMFAESKICYSLVLTLLVPLILEIDFVLHLWLGNDVPEYTSVFSVIVLLIMLVSTLNTPLSQVIHATGKMKVYQLVTGSITCAIIPISWVFLKLGFSPTSVFIVSFFMTIINQVASIFVVRKAFPYSIKHYMQTVIIPCLIMSICLPILPSLWRMTMSEGFVRLFLVCLTDIVVASMLFFVIVLNSNERITAIQMIRKKIRIIE